MSLSSELLATLKQELTQTKNWQEEVRCNSLRQLAVYLVSFTHPQYAFQFIGDVKNESRMPRGIQAIDNILNDDLMDDAEKIRDIKNILLKKNYDGQTEKRNNSWIRTDATHLTYCNMARAIASYEKQTKPELTFLNDFSDNCHQETALEC
ncbi:hypothetical protein [Legionella spiritensis]|uniref:Uncharacterized protein n=1 Tax=Legionella spiritensis TaxID=452 RepID=A0A0W0Z9E9_LEGSP|nr:hypothetical protein [Legionella spiritensis]KTD65719.1 hypothetical protein Lspi_0431 [Legionella spiritensis]SNV43296.1 Uncharacterised protein [Legionella spiritensis]VEG90621.1 Uncharacterised protein [Legionella spiritensis]